ncbi:DNA-binding response regulator, OmpR family, contains REC and winged-helix (wHTH) domain [Paraoerskovia marina]|uniref:DNA-binding response regulator, OmpR family, contains REC and winged-helix (WHTH) domain n=1 Tax=Paraoerskovia marina TaxID=545619 RepID=A0A1H1PHP8_9CELL|nr:response regulator transcription factor [Paraoerskovia marina]SDS10821.1 DNA-binding response regulator, OmpR family, contains REC and winged-helix (wHTH) domain [Paraoerskovia marina]
MPAKILVVDDDDLIAASVVAHVRAAGHDARQSADAATAEHEWRTWRPDVVVLDVRLPGRSGLDLLRRHREDGDGTPVVLLSGLGTVDDRIVGLEVGADDYLAKPFDARELVLRVEALLRRGAVAVEPTPSRITVGKLTVDASDRTAVVDGDGAPRRAELAPREFALLQFLALHPGRSFSRRELLRRVWGWDFGDDSTVMVHVRRLRAKLEADPADPQILINVRGAGYCVAAPAPSEEHSA